MSKPKEVWLDLLCWESIVKILFRYGSSINKIHFFQVSALFSPFQRLVQKVSGIPQIQVRSFVASEQRMGRRSSYEVIHSRIRSTLRKAGREWACIDSVSKRFQPSKFNPEKFRRYLGNLAFNYFYRPIEMKVAADISSGTSGCLVIRKNQFSQRWAKELGSDSICFYRTYFSHYFPISNRDRYMYDKIISEDYYSGRMKHLIHIRNVWRFALTNLFHTLGHNSSDKEDHSTRKVNIGVELLHSRIRLDEINDLFWLESSNIDPQTVYTIDQGYLKDPESERILYELKTKKTNYGSTGSYSSSENKSFCLFKKFRKWEILNGYYLLKLVLGIVFHFNEEIWVHLHFLRYCQRVAFWQNFYKEYDISILWSMSDVGADQLAKSQALENLGGMLAGSHWSNFAIQSGLTQKQYDVVMVWSDHFLKNVFSEYSYLGTFTVGYLCDHYFGTQLKRARKLRSQHKGKFIISYHDNIMGNDIAYSTNMQIKMHKMFLSILERNDNVVLFLKPKREFVLNEIRSLIPELMEWEESGRIVVFLGETPNTKAVPAMVGMASDLVIGLGISTAAAECYFAGTLAFNADLTGFENNDFSTVGLGKVVFRDIESLAKAIQDCVDSGTDDKYQEYCEIYRLLDPFQDGKAYKRAGFILRNLQELLSRGLPREESIRITEELYRSYINS